MMEIDEQLERQICRSLDGELSEDEQLALDRELIRNPHARALMAEYAANDQLASRLLDETVSATAPSPRLRLSAARAGRWRSTLRWIVPGAIAAALLATVIPFPAWDRSAPARVATAPVQPPRVSLDTGASMRQVSNDERSGPRFTRDRGREIIGVVGDDGNLYWIEVERTRTVKRPSGVGDPTRSGNEF